jgi:hypothetical protein
MNLLGNAWSTNARPSSVRSWISAEFLESEDLLCDLSQIAYFVHWVTPDIYSMRFDTRFFAAILPPGQIPLIRF